MESFAKSLFRNSSEFKLMSLICFDGFSLHPNIAHPTKKEKIYFSSLYLSLRLQLLKVTFYIQL